MKGLLAELAGRHACQSKKTGGEVGISLEAHFITNLGDRKRCGLQKLLGSGDPRQQKKIVGCRSHISSEQTHKIRAGYMCDCKQCLNMQILCIVFPDIIRRLLYHVLMGLAAVLFLMKRRRGHILQDPVYIQAGGQDGGSGFLRKALHQMGKTVPYRIRYRNSGQLPFRVDHRKQ